MEWYWAIGLYLLGIVIGVGCMILGYKLIKDEDTKKTKDKK